MSSLKFSLFSTIWAIFSWATNVYDGGFLNDIFMVTPNSTIALSNASSSPTIMNILYQNLFGGGRQNLGVYRWLPPDLRSGDEASHQVAILTGVTIFLSILLLLMPLGVIIVNCNCRCCCKKRGAFDTKLDNQIAGRISPHHGKDIYGDSILIEKLHVQTLHAIKSSRKNDDRIRIYHVTVFALTIVLLLTLLVIVCILFFSGSLFTEILVEDQSTTTSLTFDADAFNLIGGMKYVTNQIIEFLTSGAVTGNASSTEFLIQANSTLMTLLEKQVSTAVDDLLRIYGIESLINTGKGLQNDLEVLKINMEIIRLNNQKVSADISNLVGQFKVIHGLVNSELGKTCAADMGVEIGASCSSLQSRVSILLIQFNASAIKVDPPAVLNFIFTELGIDLEEILAQFGQLTAKVMEIKDQVLGKVSSFLDFNSYFSFITDIWTAVTNETTTLNATLNNFIANIAEGMAKSRTLAYAIINAPICVFLAIFVGHLVIAVLYAMEAKNTKLFYMEKNIPTISSHVCSRCGNLIHAILIFAFLLFAVIVIFFLLPACVLFVNNGCAYLTDQRGVEQTDCVLNSFVATELWPNVLKQITDSTDSQVNEYLILAPPKNIINAMTIMCKQDVRGTQLGLLEAIGWTSVVNISSLFNSKEVIDKINEGETIIKEEIVKMDLASLIPKDLDKIIKTTQNLTLYFDNINYQSSIDELSPDRMPTADIVAFANDLENLNKMMLQAGFPASSILQSSVDLIRRSLDDLNVARPEIERLREAFIAVQSRRTLTTTLTSLIDGIEEVQVILNNNTALLNPVSQVYFQLVDVLKMNLETDLNPLIQAFVHELFPCSSLYAASNAILAMFCRNSGGITRLAAWVLMLAFTTIVSTLLFVSLFHLGFTQAHHFQQLIRKSPQPTTMRFPPQDRYYQMPYGDRAPPATVQPASLFDYQKSTPQSTLTHVEPAGPSMYEYVEQREINLLRSASVSGTEDIISEHGETELQTDQPVPLPRSGNRFLPLEREEVEKEEIEEKEMEEKRTEQELEDEEYGKDGEEMNEESEKTVQESEQSLPLQVVDYDI